MALSTIDLRYPGKGFASLPALWYLRKVCLDPGKPCPQERNPDAVPRPPAAFKRPFGRQRLSRGEVLHVSSEKSGDCRGASVRNRSGLGTRSNWKPVSFGTDYRKPAGSCPSMTILRPERSRRPSVFRRKLSSAGWESSTGNGVWNCCREACEP